jgi:hypothetical protein
VLIFKRKAMTNVKIPRGIVHVQEKGWLDENRMKLWLEKGVAKHPGGLLKRPAILVCDQFKLTHNCGSKEEDQGLKHVIYCNTRRPH